MSRFLCPVCGLETLYQHLPVDPLIQLAERFKEPDREGEQVPHGLRGALGANLARYYLRAVQTGCLTTPLADRLAVALGVHPGNVWDDWADLPDGAAGTPDPLWRKERTAYYREYRRSNSDRINARVRQRYAEQTA